MLKISQVGTPNRAVTLKLEGRIVRKRQIFARYRDSLKDADVQFVPTDLEQVAPWFVDIFVDEPEKLAATLKSNGIGTRPIYPPLHSQPIYSGKHSAGLEVTTRVYSRGLCLPSSVDLRDDQIDQICDKVRKGLGA